MAFAERDKELALDTIDNIVLECQNAKYCRYNRWHKPVHGYQQDSVLRYQADRVVHGEPQVAEYRAEVPGPLEDVDAVERHGHGAYEQVGSCQADDEVVARVSDRSLDRERYEHEDVAEDGEEDAYADGDGYEDRLP